MNFPNPFHDRPGAVRSRLGGIYFLLVAANVAAWVWAYAEFRDHPVLLARRFWPMSSASGTLSTPTTSPPSTMSCAS